MPPRLYSLPLVQGDDEENSGPKYEYIGEKHPEDPTQQHGKGKAIYANGDEFEGTYVQGKRDGPGVYQWIKMVMDEEEGVEKPAQDDEGNKVRFAQQPDVHPRSNLLWCVGVPK